MEPEQIPSQFIGPQLRAAREIAGLRQSELARLLKIDPAMVSRWEYAGSTRYVPVPAKHFDALAYHLNVPVDDLVPGLRRSPTLPPPDAALPPNGLIAASAIPDPPKRPTVPANYSTEPTDAPPSRQPGLPEKVGEDGLYRVRLRCPWCRTMNSTFTFDPARLPTICLGCGGALRASVRLSRPDLDH